ncbi:Hsp20/alpha crystallin family protein [Candidatus Nitrosocosmicus franklandus]|uniref:Hsp20/alpha crystallin family protein n=2 Tax=Candidatus Nitrosocosmicus franklandianus TaxID=1798806 RepID=A0A484I9H9_9ARCH|nr:Hsp20/alpha crystallin family protein [Candidatus Nitrosocosmicus franklandus]
MFDYWDRNMIRRNSFRNFFDPVDREFAQAEEMMNRIFNTARGINTTNVNAFRETATFPYYYGYQITIGPDGKPRVRELGNVKPRTRGLVESSSVRQPLLDTIVDEKNNSLVITAEMPGLSKENIKVNIAEDLITIHGEKDRKKYHTEIPLNMEIDNSFTKASYSNGILELRLKLKNQIKSRGKEIKIE